MNSSRSPKGVIAKLAANIAHRLQNVCDGEVLPSGGRSQVASPSIVEEATANQTVASIEIMLLDAAGVGENSLAGATNDAIYAFYSSHSYPPSFSNLDRGRRRTEGSESPSGGVSFALAGQPVPCGSWHPDRRMRNVAGRQICGMRYSSALLRSRSVSRCTIGDRTAWSAYA
jgi:hypothetical protein